MKGQSLDARRLGFKLGQHSSILYLKKEYFSHSFALLLWQSPAGYGTRQQLGCGGWHNDQQRYQTRIYIFRIFKPSHHSTTPGFKRRNRNSYMRMAKAITKPSIATTAVLLLRYPCFISRGCGSRRCRCVTTLLLVCLFGAVPAWTTTTTRLGASCAALALRDSKTKSASALQNLCVAPAGSAATFSGLPNRRTQPIQARLPATASDNIWTRPEFMNSWRAAVATIMMTASSAPFSAATSTDSVDSIGDGNTAWTALRREVLSDTGGVAYLTACVARADFSALLEYTKTYETKLRKGYLTPAKKQLPKEQQDAATLLINAATFDLIGINRSARPGQESLETATKYVQMLSEDLARFLALEPVPPL
jgi:hypothetical protein